MHTVPKPLVWAIALLALLPAAAATAQIFPKLEKREITRRLAEQQAEPQQPEPAAPAPADDAPWRAYETRLLEYQRGYASGRAATLPHVAQFHPSVRDYAAGILALRLGDYREADRLMRGVGHSVRREPDAPGPQLQTVLQQIRTGRAHYFRAIAVAMQQWQSFDSEEALSRAWETAARDANRAAGPLRQLPEAEASLRAVEAWLAGGLEAWLEQHRAQGQAQRQPDDPASWRRLAAAAAPLELAARERLPLFLSQRAALSTLIEFWPQHEFVSGGFAHIGLGNNSLQLFRLDEWQTSFEPQEIHSEGGRRALAAARAAAAGLAAALEALKVE